MSGGTLEGAWNELRKTFLKKILQVPAEVLTKFPEEKNLDEIWIELPDELQ